MGKIYIKNMVCPRCIMSVREIFRRNGIEPEDVQLGVVTASFQETEGRDRESQTVPDTIRRDLEACGFEIIDDRRARIVEGIRTGVIEYIRNPGLRQMKLSEFLQEKCMKEYSALSKLFTGMRGMTIEKYCILQKVEYVKELLFYGELNISEIADLLHYSSTAHLSSQFKSVTGLTPTQFRQLKAPSLSPIDTI